MVNSSKHVNARLVPGKSVCRDGAKIIGSSPDTGAVVLNWHDVAEGQLVVCAENDSIINLCATASDIASKAISSVVSETVAVDGKNDDDLRSNSPVCAGSPSVDYEVYNFVVTEGATVGEEKAPLSSASADVPSENGLEFDTTVVLPSGM